jgi:outer membrane protein TolC
MPLSKRISSSFCVLLAACSGGPQIPLTTDGDNPAARASVADAADPGPLRSPTLAGGATEANWLRTLGDPELEDIVAEALRHNREPAAASTNLRAAEQFASQAGDALAEAIVSGEEAGIPGPAGSNSGNFGAAFNLQWETEVWQRLDAAAAATASAPSLFAADLDAARQSLIAQTAKAWFAAVETNLQLALSQQGIELRERILAELQSRGAVGEAERAVIRQAAGDLQAARERQRLAIGALIQALRGIEVILGRYPSAELAQVRELVPEPAALPAAISAPLLERRPDLRAAQRRVAAVFEQAPTARVTGLPQLSLNDPAGGASSELSALLEHGNDFFSHTANFVVPHALGEHGGTGVAIETARQREALQDYGKVARRALRDAATALDNELRLRRRKQLLSTSMEESTARLAAAGSHGEGPPAATLELLELQARAIDARMRLVRAGNARLAQRVDLHLALGGDFAN